jgi:hypothetical protein
MMRSLPGFFPNQIPPNRASGVTQTGYLPSYFTAPAIVGRDGYIYKLRLVVNLFPVFASLIHILIGF